VSGGDVAAAYFFDTSALAKRYVQEPGTSWVRSLTHRGTANQIYVARVTAVEVTAAVARRRKGKRLTAPKAADILRRFRQHLAGRYTVIEITPALWTAAMMLANAHALRAYDALQLAVAIEVYRDHQNAALTLVTLVSGDRDLNAAALAEGLPVEDPNTHP
jgi:uncharacterized protein